MEKVTRPGKICAKIGPSVLNADLSKLYEESQKLVDMGADYLHLDVMDGHFVPNLTFGHPVIQCLTSKMKKTFFETHMMVSNPDQWIEDISKSHVDQYTFHVEASKDVKTTCRKIRESGMKAGIALKPGTPIKAVEEYIDFADMILVMTVEPGFGGQKFMEPMMEKVKWLRENYPTLDIEVDGGVGPSNIQTCAEAGANMIVSGTGIINAPNMMKAIKEMSQCVQSCIDKREKQRQLSNDGGV